MPVRHRHLNPLLLFHMLCSVMTVGRTHSFVCPQSKGEAGRRGPVSGGHARWESWGGRCTACGGWAVCCWEERRQAPIDVSFAMPRIAPCAPHSHDHLDESRLAVLVVQGGNSSSTLRIGHEDRVTLQLEATAAESKTLLVMYPHEAPLSKSIKVTAASPHSPAPCWAPRLATVPLVSPPSLLTLLSHVRASQGLPMVFTRNDNASICQAFDDQVPQATQPQR